MTGTLFVVATPIGNLEDVSFRAVRQLKEVALIAAEDTRRTAVLLQRHGIATPTTSFHEHNERERLPGLLSRLERGESIAVVSDAGTPGISDPGFRLVRAALDRGLRVEAIPGASAVLTALVVSGLPIHRFVFEGFAPPKAMARRAWLEQLAGETRTVAFYEAPHRLRATLSEALAVLGDREAVVARELTKLHEEVARGRLSVLLEHFQEPRGEVTVVLAGQSENTGQCVAAPSDTDLCLEFGQLTETGLGRREALTALARRYGMPSRDLYAALERAKRHD